MAREGTAARLVNDIIIIGEESGEPVRIALGDIRNTLQATAEVSLTIIHRNFISLRASRYRVTVSDNKLILSNYNRSFSLRLSLD